MRRARYLVKTRNLLGKGRRDLYGKSHMRVGKWRRVAAVDTLDEARTAWRTQAHRQGLKQDVVFYRGKVVVDAQGKVDAATLAASRPKGPTEYEVEDLPGLEALVVTDRGEENTYFDLLDGSQGFVKADVGGCSRCLGPLTDDPAGCSTYRCGAAICPACDRANGYCPEHQREELTCARPDGCPNHGGTK